MQAVYQVAAIYDVFAINVFDWIEIEYEKCAMQLEMVSI